MAEEPQDPNKKQKPLTYAGNWTTYFQNFETHLKLIIALTSLALQLDSKQAKTSFGKLPLSCEKSNPIFGFTQAKRDEAEKLFLGDVTKNNNIAKQSPGPVYIYQDQIKYTEVSILGNR
jgi:hypothetical protein